MTTLTGHGIYLAALVEQSPMGVAIFDTDLRYVVVNEAMAAINGRAAADHVGARMRDLLPGRGADAEAVLFSVLQTGTPLVGVLNRSPAADAAPGRVLEAAYYRLRSADGSPLGVAAFVTDVSDRQAAVEAFAAAQFRLALVNEASAKIGSTLDLDRTARELVDVAVPRFADAAVVDLDEGLLLPESEPQDTSRGMLTYRLAVASQVPARLPHLPHQAGDLVRHPPASPAWQAMDSGRTVTGKDAEDDTLLQAARGASGEDGLGSYLMTPLVSRGQVLGVAGFARTVESRPFDDLDQALAEELAARAATAVDNARLYGRERSTALALQRALLPQESPRLAGVEVAARYVPGVVATEVGGDWYDVIPLACGRVALVVGDVMGRGLRAAAAMGQLRTAVRTLAVLDLTPDNVLTQLDVVAHSLEGGQFATCVYAVYDPAERMLCYASAGHPPPAVRTPDGQVDFLPLASGAPLGVGGVPFEVVQCVVTDGSLFVLYTDGLVESRTDDIDAGLANLREALARAPVHRLDELCDSVTSTLRRADGHSDDVALLVGRLNGLGADATASWQVSTDRAAVADVRTRVARTLRAWHLEALLEPFLVITSELVTNAIRHGRQPLTLRLLRLDDALVAAVGDADTRLPRLRSAGEHDESGRGLHLVGSLSRRWGARPTPEGKVVWSELALPASSVIR